MTPCIICIIRLLLPVDLSTYLSFFSRIACVQKGPTLSVSDSATFLRLPSPQRCPSVKVKSFCKVHRTSFLDASEGPYYLPKEVTTCFAFLLGPASLFALTWACIRGMSLFHPSLHQLSQRIARKKTGFLTCGELDDYPLSWYPDLAIYFCFCI